MNESGLEHVIISSNNGMLSVPLETPIHPSSQSIIGGMVRGFQIPVSNTSWLRLGRAFGHQNFIPMDSQLPDCDRSSSGCVNLYKSWVVNPYKSKSQKVGSLPWVKCHIEKLKTFFKFFFFPWVVSYLNVVQGVTYTSLPCPFDILPWCLPLLVRPRAHSRSGHQYAFIAL